MLLPSIAGAHGAIPAVPSFTPSSSHGHRRLVLHPGSTAHALPRLGAVAVPDESLATALLSQQPQQQQQQQASVRRSRTAQHVQPPTELQQQLTALQQATQQQQQALWQVQAAQQAPARGRQQARPGQSDYSSQNAGNRQGSFQRGHQSPNRQQQQQQQYQQRPHKQQGYRGYQSDQQDESFPQQQQHNRSWQPSQQGFPQQRWGEQQQQQQRHQSQHRRQQQQQQTSNWQEEDAAGDRQQRFQQQRRHNRPQQQLPNQQQELQRHGSNEIAASDACDGSSSSSSSSKPELRFTYGLQQDWSLPTGMAVTYLGSSSGSPTRDRNVSCTVLRLPESLYLVDCGEGSSRQAKLTGMQLEQVDTIFITHLHGDHCFGIGTMLVSLCRAHKAAAAANGSSSDSSSSSDSLPGPDSPTALRVVGPPRLGELLSSMLFIAGVARQLDQPVYITEFVEDDSEAHDWEPLPPPASVSSFSSPTCQAFIRRLAPTKQLQGQDWPAGLSSRLDSTGLQWESRKRNNVGNFYAKVGLLWELPCRKAMVTAAQLQHRVPCWGYVFEEKVGAGAAAGADAGGSSSSSGSAGQGRRVVLLGDTMDSRAIAPAAHGADLVSHEATFAAGMEGKAATAQHSTAWMAGQFAWAIQAKALVLTHFSARYEGSAASKRPPAGHGGQWSRAPDSGHGDASDKEAEERTIKALQREADDQYGLGPILLAIDLLTAHVPTREGPEAVKA